MQVVAVCILVFEHQADQINAEHSVVDYETKPPSPVFVANLLHCDALQGNMRVRMYVLQCIRTRSSHVF